MPRRASSDVKEGDEVILKGRVTYVVDDDGRVAVRIQGYRYPVTLSAKWLEKLPRQKAAPLVDAHRPH